MVPKGSKVAIAAAFLAVISTISAAVERGLSPARIVASWQSNVASFRAARAPYLLY
jgi:hypothetical protein